MRNVTPWIAAAFVTLAVGALAASEAQAKPCGCSGSKPSPAPAPAPAPKPPAPAPAPTPAPVPAPAPAPSTSGGHNPLRDPQYLSTIQHRLVPPVVAEVDLDPPAAGPVEREVIRIDYPPEVRVLRVEVPTPVLVEAPPKIGIVHAGSVLFDTGRADMGPVAQVTTKILVARALQVPGASIGVAVGHADIRGRADRNAKLAQARAEAVVAWLVAWGFPRERIVLDSHGDTQPLFPGRTPADHQGNRRVDVTITGVVQ